MIKNPKLLAVCLIVANVFFFGAYAYVFSGIEHNIEQRAAIAILFFAFNLFGFLVYLLNED